jgi:AcrR family transcriptional regulator
MLNRSRSVNAKQAKTHLNGKRSSLQARKQQVVRDAIWDAAIDLFAQNGFDETTVDHIVEAAGVSRPSFFRYFSSKSDLITQRQTVSLETTAVNALQSCPPSYSPLEVLRHTVLEVARHTVAEPRTRKIMEIAERYPSAQAALSNVAQAHFSVAQAFARRCKGSKARVTGYLLSGLMLSILSAAFHSWLENSEQDMLIATDEVFASLHHLVCDVIKPGEKNPQTRPNEKRKRPRP